ncbi:MAG: hypothetical protein AB7E79_09680 [Rhodospirillaceae bacterium]
MDAYDLQARHAPALLTILPIVLVLAAIAPRFQSAIVIPAAISAVVLTGLQYWLARIARTKGSGIEADLYFKWNGKPTTAMLRHADERINQHTKLAYHAGLERLCARFQAPTAAEERADPLGADAMYETAIDELRRRAKEQAVPAVHRENISYGFARNLFGLKAWGISIAGGCLLATLVIIGLRTNWQFYLATQIEIGLVVILSLYIGAWILGVTDRFVRVQAEGYSRALLETIPT